MSQKHNHYEKAFESFLRGCSVPYLAVNESHRNRLQTGESVKNLDFVVSVPRGLSWLVDVKGRKFPSGCAGRSYWKNWTTHDDLIGMAHWQALFGNHYTGLLVFAYWVCGELAPVARENLFPHRGRTYAFLAVPFFEYLSQSRLISPRWRTYSISHRIFRNLARPFQDYIGSGRD